MSAKGETAAITPELYNAIVTIVDDRTKGIQVTREDFNELRAIATELASAQRELAHAQAKTEEALKELAMQVGKLSDNIGFSLEDMARVVLPGYLERHIHIYVDNLDRRFFFVDGKEVEMNLYGVGKKDGKKITLLGVVKSRIYEREVNKFIRDVATVLPVIKGAVLKVMFGYLVHPNAVKRGEAEDVILVASYQR